MAHITRRNVLLAGLKLPGIVEAAYRDKPSGEGAGKSKRFEVAEVVAGHPWRFCRLAAWSSTDLTIRWGRTPSSFPGSPNAWRFARLGFLVLQ
jgi:hypothetical protein